MTGQNRIYQCTLCKAEYSNREDAVLCESRHKGGPMRVTEVFYRKPWQGDCEYPVAMNLVMTDGTILTFVRPSAEE